MFYPIHSSHGCKGRCKDSPGAVSLAKLVDVLKGLSSVVLYYVNHANTKTAEFMEFDESGKVVRVVANYSF